MNGGTQAGVAGLYPLDTQQCYYFFGFPVEQVNFAKCRNSLYTLPTPFSRHLFLSLKLLPYRAYTACWLPSLGSFKSANSWERQAGRPLMPPTKADCSAQTRALSECKSHRLPDLPTLPQDDSQAV